VLRGLPVHRDRSTPVTDPAPVVDGAVFRRVIGNFMSGVVVITTEHDGVRYGITVSAVSSLSLDPSMLLICLNSRSGTQQAVHRAERFAVNILAEHQGHLAERFATSGSADKFAGLETRTSRPRSSRRRGVPGGRGGVRRDASGLPRGGGPRGDDGRLTARLLPREVRQVRASSSSRRTRRSTGSCARWGSAAGWDPTSRWRWRSSPGG
jgi:hypothetical protein